MPRSEVAVETIQVIKQELEEQRRKSERRRPLLSSQETITRQAVLDIDKLIRTTDNLMDKLRLLQAQFDPFSEEHNQVEQAIKDAQLTVQRVRYNINLLPPKLRTGE